VSGKQIGKIEWCAFGVGGYQDAQFGVSFTFSGKGWGVGGWFIGGWGTDTKVGPNTKWTEEDRTRSLADTMRFVDNTLRAAKVSSFDKLKNIPVEVTFEDNVIKSWRILEEVL
jgi:hypothetical protein